MTTLIPNATARRIFLSREDLSADPDRALDREGLYQLIHDLGFVQVDSIATVVRAHEQIVFSRSQSFDREHMRRLRIVGV